MPSSGYAVFFGIKFVGYTMAALFLNRTFPEKVRNPFVVGLVRTLIGATVGFAAYEVSAGIGLIDFHRGSTIIHYLGVFSVVRVAEWLILIRMFYWTDSTRDELKYTLPALILWSFFLDLPALLGIIVTGGVLIC